ncbi:MAG: TIR domain-containing protein [Thermogemmatispora sp.]|uniref:phosphorylase family protein n=1 Tax=Thermogemmatispora sp. TaxID=1968838 RepID=UPI00262D47C9|nr:TIR domain-containing protein [Thermogemmatispora sp.]MBX5459092.1 TIR domain-containing protein [Thermogemmatispora sp.]
MPVNLFYLCSRSEEDERLLAQLKNFLSTLRSAQLISDWGPQQLRAGQSIREELRRRLSEAQIVLILLSPDLLTDRFYPELLQLAWERHQRAPERVRLLPVKLRECAYEQEPFAELDIFPPNGKSLHALSLAQRERELKELAIQIRELAEELAASENVKARPGEAPTASFRPVAQAGASESAGTGRSGSLSSVRRCDLLLVTATDVEVQAVREIAQREWGARFEREYGRIETYYFLGEIGGTVTWLLRTEMGAQGAGGATLAVSEAIQRLKPAAVIMVGIAFGLRPGEQQLGDILVSKQLMSYEPQRVGAGASGEMVLRPRGDRATASPRLLARFRDGALDWNGPEPHFGLLLSGEKLVDHPDLLRQLLAIEPEAIGGEMEGAGLYAAATRERCEWIVVKAICDWGDGHKSENKEENQRLAAENAARFVLSVLGSGGLRPS